MLGSLQMPWYCPAHPHQFLKREQALPRLDNQLASIRSQLSTQKMRLQGSPSKIVNFRYEAKGSGIAD